MINVPHILSKICFIISKRHVTQTMHPIKRLEKNFLTNMTCFPLGLLHGRLVRVRNISQSVNKNGANKIRNLPLKSYDKLKIKCFSLCLYCLLSLCLKIKYENKQTNFYIDSFILCLPFLQILAFYFVHWSTLLLQSHISLKLWIFSM